MGQHRQQQDRERLTRRNLLQAGGALTLGMLVAEPLAGAVDAPDVVAQGAATPPAIGATPAPIARTVSVKDFGAKGDGAALEDDAFQKALSTPGPLVVQVPKGKYLFAKGVRLGNDVTLQGEGEGSVLIAKPGSNINLVRNVDEKGGNRNIVVSDLRLEGNHDQQSTGNCIALWNVSGGTVKNVHGLDGRDSCIHIRASHGIRVEACVAEGAGNDNVHVWDGSSDIALINVKALKSRGTGGGPDTPVISTGFEISDDAHDITLTDCEADENATDGISIHNHSAKQVGKDRFGPTNVTLHGFHASRNGRFGINILAQSPNPPDGIVIDGATVEESGKAGINIDGKRIGHLRLNKVSITHCLYGLRIATSVTLDLATVEISDSRSYGVNVTSTVTAPLNLQQINCTKGGDYGMLCAASNVTLTTCQASANVRGGFYISGDKTTLRQCVSDGNAADPKLGDGVGFDIFGNLCRLDKCEAKGNARDGVRIRNAQGTTITQGDYSTNGFDAIREVGRADGTTVRDIVATGYQSEAIVLSGGKSTVTGVQGSGQ